MSLIAVDLTLNGDRRRVLGADLGNTVRTALPHSAEWQAVIDLRAPCLVHIRQHRIHYHPPDLVAGTFVHEAFDATLAAPTRLPILPAEPVSMPAEEDFPTPNRHSMGCGADQTRVE
ncbi:hypothetical protein J6590_060856 [Homalodisca vitripennis]|nr:hypothetical protein J6590_060856 [Homalodisca vitripennis]